MKNLLKVLVAVFAVASMLSSCTTAGPSEAILKIYNLGDKKGKIETLGTGRYANHLFGYHKFIVYPTNMQRYSWTADEREDSKNDESIVYQVGGMEISSDVGCKLEFEVEMLEIFYRKFKSTPEEFIRKYLYASVRNSMTFAVKGMTVEDAYDLKKDSVLILGMIELNEEYNQYGVKNIKLEYLSNVRLPKKVKDALDIKYQAVIDAQARENEIQSSIAEAQKLIEAAKGKAEAIRIEGEELAKNPSVLELRRIEAQMEFAKNQNVQTLVIGEDQGNLLLNLGGK